jgi:hypothetical protein
VHGFGCLGQFTLAEFVYSFNCYILAFLTMSPFGGSFPALASLSLASL